MAFTAMAERLGKIGPPVPFGRAVRIWLKAPSRIEQHIPEPHQIALIVGKGEVVSRRPVMHRFQAEQISLDRQYVGIG